MKKVFLVFSVFFLSQFSGATTFEPYFPFVNLSYVVYKAPQPVEIDGDIYTEEWEKAPWTEYFQDIKGSRNPVEPKYKTRAKMLWDRNYFYVAVELEEPHIWATLKNRDDIIYRDNDIEFFIDPSGCGKNYREFEFNAFNTQWDLLLTSPPYRGGNSIMEWNIDDMKTAVKLYGTINDPSDIDEKWTFEAAIPIKSLSGFVRPGTQWRMNFSRVEWLKITTKDGKYSKVEGTDRFGCEENWLWSPTGAYDAHRPERWGWIQFSGITVGEDTENFNWNNGHEYKEALWTISNRIMQYRLLNGKMPETFEDLELENPMGMKLVVMDDRVFYLSLKTENGITYSLTNDGYIKMHFDKNIMNTGGPIESTPGFNPYRFMGSGIPRRGRVTDLESPVRDTIQALMDIY